MTPPLDSIDAEHIEQGMRQRFWQLLEARIQQDLASTSRDAIQSRGDDHIHAQGRYAAYESVLRIPKNLLQEAKRHE